MKYRYLPFLTIFFTKLTPILSQTESQLLEAIDLANTWLGLDDDNTATTIRFGFHSCHGTAGCNGCLNMAHEDNAGLGPVYNQLNEYYDSLSSKDNFTRADFWNVFFVEALNRANVSPNFQKQHTVGRTDCATSPTESDLWEYPNPRKGWAHVLEQFGPNSEYGNSIQEVVALIAGGHSLGEAELENSGFQHPWDGSEEEANNAFIRHMVQDRYESGVNPEGNHQWTHTRPNGGGGGGDGELLGLNTDLAIVKTFEFDESTGEVTDVCKTDSRTCDDNPDTVEIVNEYVNDNNKLGDDFAAVYYKLLRKGYANGIVKNFESEVVNAGGKQLYSFLAVVFAFILI